MKPLKANKGVEFTPVGGRPLHLSSSDRERGSPVKQTHFRRSPLKKSVLPDLSFLHSGDDASSYASSPVAEARFTGADIFDDSTVKRSSNFENVYNSHSEGVNEVQNERNALSRENVELKLELQTLRQMLKPGSLDAAGLVHKLKMQNMELFNENTRLSEKLKQTQENENSFGSPGVSKTNELMASLRKEHELLTLQLRQVKEDREQTQMQLREVAEQRDEALEEKRKLQDQIYELEAKERSSPAPVDRGMQRRYEEQIEQKDDVIYDLESKIRRLEDDRDQLQADFDELKFKFSNRSIHEPDDDKIRFLESQLNEVTDQLKQQKARRQTDDSTSKVDLDRLQQELLEEKKLKNRFQGDTRALEDKIKILEEYISDVELDRADLNEECLRLRNIVQQSAASTSDDAHMLKLQNLQLRQNLETAQSRLKSYQAETSVATTLHELESENRKLKEQLMFQSSTPSPDSHHLRAENDSLRYEMNNVRKQYERTISDLEKRLETSQTKLIELQYQTTRSEANQTETRQSEMENMIRTKASLEAKLRNSTQEIESLKSNVELLRKQLSQQKPSNPESSRMEAVMRDLDTLKDENKNLQKDLRDVREQARDWEWKYSQATKQKEKLDEVVASLERDVRALKEDAPSLDRKLRSLSLEANSNEQRYRSLFEEKSEEYLSLREKFDTMRRDLVGKVEQLVEQREMLKQKEADLSVSLTRSQDEIYELSKKVRNLESELSVARSRSRELEPKVSKVEDSANSVMKATHQLLLSKYSTERNKVKDLQVANSCLGVMLHSQEDEVTLLKSRGVYSAPSPKIKWSSIGVAICMANILRKTLETTQNRRAKDDAFKREIKYLRSKQ